MHSVYINDYNESDKERVVAVMKKKPWAHHLTVVLETKIDANGDWREIIRTEMVPENAEQFMNHYDDFFLTIVQSKAVKDQFILAENCFGIFEGNVVWDTPYGHQVFPYHLFAPISAHLAHVLRKTVLIDSSAPIAVRALVESGVTSLPGIPPLRPSFLADLPVSLPKTPWRDQLYNTWQPQGKSETDEYIFDITNISTRHAAKARIRK
jgi:hypothetical protein